jgi:hypothetical protein
LFKVNFRIGGNDMTVQGVGSSTDYYNELMKKKAEETGSAATATSDTSTQTAATTLVPDVAEISEDGGSVSQNSTTATSANTTTQASSDGTTITSTDGDVAEISAASQQATQSIAKPSGGASEAAASTSSSSDSSETEDLSSYTEAQLKQMVKKGTISEAQYNTEITKREAQKAMEEQNSSSQKTDDSQSSSTTSQTNSTQTSDDSQS